MERAVAAATVLTSTLIMVACAPGADPHQTTTASPTTTTTTTPTTTTSSRASGQTATASDGSFIVALPNGWRAESQQSALIKLTYAGHDVDFRVGLVQPEYRGRTLNESAELEEKRLVKQLKAVLDAGGIESTSVDGEPAARFTVTIPADKTPPASPESRVRLLMVRHHDAEYLVQLTVTPPADFNDALPDYEFVMTSWKWST